MKNEMLLVEKTNIFNTSVREEELKEIGQGEVLFKINKFALTTNNITYAVTGFQLRYWDFFPAENDWGIIPCWGFATVIQSENESIKEGEQVYGYFPMAKYLKIEAGKINDHSLMDIASHRQEMAPIYNTYTRLGTEMKYPKAVQDYIPIFQPLFATSFLNYQFIKSSSFFEAENIIITSASSKTALGLAFMLHQNKSDDKKKIIGLTSSRNVAFVESVGFYDEVLSYDKVPNELENIPSMVVDMAGNADLLSNIYKHLDKQLKFISKIGLTDWSAASMEEKIPVAKFFFAPTFAQAFFKKHGAKEANGMIVKTMFSFITQAKEWIEIGHMNTYADLEKKYLDMLKGEVNPSKGWLVLD